MSQPTSDAQRLRVRSSAGTIVASAVTDVVLVLAFVLIGRGSHGENVIGGALVTFWPFAVGLAVGWLVCLAWRRPMNLWPTGVVVWAATIVVGMLLRVASGQGVVVAFVIVAAVVLAIFLVGWRAVATLVAVLRLRRAMANSAAAVDAADH